MILVGERLCVMGDWDQSPVPEARLVVRLTPGRSFGTGAHPSTRAFLERLEAIVTPDCTVLDLGAGSGILAIASVLLGARAATAVDWHREATDAVRRNTTANGLAGAITVVEGKVEEVALPAADIVLLNLDTVSVIEAILSRLSSSASGTLLVTMLELINQAVIEGIAVASGFEKTYQMTVRQWVLITFRKA